MPTIRRYADGDEDAVVALWQACGLTRAWNDPRRDIARKLADSADGFFVAVVDGRVAGTAMAGYDGHRGWVNYLAVDMSHRRRGVGRALMQHAETWLLARGCPKLNLQLRHGNDDALAFYRRLGYAPDAVVCLGKRLIDDSHPSENA